MLKINVCNMERFMEVIAKCEGPINLLVSDGQYIDLRRDVYLQNKLFSNHENNTTKMPLHIDVSVTRDYIRLVYFMMSDC